MYDTREGHHRLPDLCVPHSSQARHHRGSHRVLEVVEPAQRDFSGPHQRLAIQKNAIVAEKRTRRNLAQMGSSAFNTAKSPARWFTNKRALASAYFSRVWCRSR